MRGNSERRQWGRRLKEYELGDWYEAIDKCRTARVKGTNVSDVAVLRQAIEDRRTQGQELSLKIFREEIA